MFAIIQTGGKQYKISKGTILKVEKLSRKEGELINLDKVLLISDDTATKIGKPLVEGAYAIAKIIAHEKADKIMVFKMKAKKRYRKTQGHRQQFTKVEITDIKASGGSKSTPEKATPEKATPEKATPEKSTIEKITTEEKPVLKATAKSKKTPAKTAKAAKTPKSE